MCVCVWGGGGGGGGDGGFIVGFSYFERTIWDPKKFR